MHATNSTGTNRCDGMCPDAYNFHGHSGCRTIEKLIRFKGRCHCAREYSFEAHVPTDEETHEAANFLTEVLEAHHILSGLNATEEGASVLISIHSVKPEIWAALNVPMGPSGQGKQYRVNGSVVSRIDFYPARPK